MVARPTIISIGECIIPASISIISEELFISFKTFILNVKVPIVSTLGIPSKGDDTVLHVSVILYPRLAARSAKDALTKSPAKAPVSMTQVFAVITSPSSVNFPANLLLGGTTCNVKNGVKYPLG